MLDFKKVWLIQRGTFNSIKNSEITGIDSLVTFDYMGSSEFEWGAKRQSLNKLLPNLDNYSITKTPLKAKDGSQGLFILAPKDIKEDVNFLVVKELAKYKPQLRLKEPTYLQDALEGGKGTEINLWWDLDNLYFFGLGKNNMTQLLLALYLLKKKWSL